jgi:hypothetical protein
LWPKGKSASPRPVARFFVLLKRLPVTVEQETPDRMLKEIVSLAREQGLSTYDASYLDLAMRFDLPIATLDASIMKPRNDAKSRSLTRLAPADPVHEKPRVRACVRYGNNKLFQIRAFILAYRTYQDVQPLGSTSPYRHVQIIGQAWL